MRPPARRAARGVTRNSSKDARAVRGNGAVGGVSNAEASSTDGSGNRYVAECLLLLAVTFWHFTGLSP